MQMIQSVFSARRCGGAAALVAMLATAACGGGDADKKAPAATSEPAKAAAAPPAATQPPATPPAAAAPPAAAPATEATPAVGGHSAVPTVAEWNAVQGEVTVRGSSALGCETKGLREWIRVSCRGDAPDRGKPVNVTVNSGGGAETFAFGAGGVSSLVYRFEVGTRVAATFRWERASHQFLAEWPRGAPKPTAYGKFD